MRKKEFANLYFTPLLRAGFVFITAALFAAGAAAQPAADANASRVVAEHNRAMGGEKQVARVKSIGALADCAGPNGPYKTEVYSAGGRKTIFKQVREKSGVYEGIVNDGTFWVSGDQPRLAGRNEVFVWRSHEFQWIAVDVLGWFRDPKFVGSIDFAGKPAARLTATDELGRPIDVFFDKETKLLSGFELADPFGGTDKIRIVYNEWRRVGKLLLPSKVTATDHQGDFVLNFHTIRINTVSHSVFAVPAKVSAIKELMAVHELQRKAHFDRDAKLLVSVFADDFTEVSDGKVSRPTREDATKRFQSYFDSVTFIEWDDIKPPVIRVSDDGRMAVMIVSKKVRLKMKADGREVTDIFAWTSVFKKIGAEWKMSSITSTREPLKEK